MLLAKIVKNNLGQEIMKEIYGNYEKFKNIYFPKRIDVYARTDKGITRNTTKYYNIRLNYFLPNKIFNIRFPENVKKRYLNGG